MKRRMKQKKYGILMFVGIAVMVIMPFAPCRADWSYLGSEGSSGLPDSDSDFQSGGNYYREIWGYAVTNIDRGGNSSGSWAVADISSSEEAQALSLFGAGGAETADPDNPQPIVWGKSFYADLPNPNYTTAGLTVDWDILADGTVYVEGSVWDSNLGGGDTLHSEAEAGAVAAGRVYGAGMVKGSVDENSNGWTWIGVQGYATVNYSNYNQPAAYYDAILDFTVDALGTDYNVADGPGPDSFTSTGALNSLADASASFSVSSGYFGSAFAYAEVDFGGWAILWVTLP